MNGVWMALSIAFAVLGWLFGVYVGSDTCRQAFRRSRILETLFDIHKSGQLEATGLMILDLSKVIPRGSLYVYLRALEDEDLIESREERLSEMDPKLRAVRGLRPRRFYRLSPKGRRWVEAHLALLAVEAERFQ